MAYQQSWDMRKVVRKFRKFCKLSNCALPDFFLLAQFAFVLFIYIFLVAQFAFALLSSFSSIAQFAFAHRLFKI